MDYKLTKETIEQIRKTAEEIIQQDKDGTLKPFLQGRKKELEDMQKKIKKPALV